MRCAGPRSWRGGRRPSSAAARSRSSTVPLIDAGRPSFPRPSIARHLFAGRPAGNYLAPSICCVVVACRLLSPVLTLSWFGWCRNGVPVIVSCVSVALRCVTADFVALSMPNWYYLAAFCYSPPTGAMWAFTEVYSCRRCQSMICIGKSLHFFCRVLFRNLPGVQTCCA